MKKFDEVYNQIISECCPENVIAESFSIKEALSKVKEAFSYFKEGLKRRSEAVLKNSIVQKVIDKAHLDQKARQLFDKMFKASIEDDTLTVEVVSKEKALEELKNAFPKSKKEERNTIQEAYSGHSHEHSSEDNTSTAEKIGFFSYASAALAGLTWLNYFFPWFWCIGLFMIATPIIADKILDWQKAKVIHYRIYKDGSMILKTDNFEEFSHTLEDISDDNCEFIAQSYNKTDVGERIIDSVSNDTRVYKDLGKVDRENGSDF